MAKIAHFQIDLCTVYGHHLCMDYDDCHRLISNVGLKKSDTVELSVDTNHIVVKSSKILIQEPMKQEKKE
jgi:hypothetical protein